MAFYLPSSAWNDFIKFALIIPLGGSVLAETTVLLLGNRAGLRSIVPFIIEM